MGLPFRCPKLYSVGFDGVSIFSRIVHKFANDKRICAMSHAILPSHTIQATEDREIKPKNIMPNPVINAFTELDKSIFVIPKIIIIIRIQILTNDKVDSSGVNKFVCLQI